MSRATQLQALISLAGIAYDSAQSKLGSIARDERALRDQLDGLQDARRALASTDRSSGDAALVAGADALWLSWVAERQGTLNAELARMSAAKARQLTVVRQAFGKREALRAIQKNEKAEAKQRKARRQL